MEKHSLNWLLKNIIFPPGASIPFELDGVYQENLSYCVLTMIIYLFLYILLFLLMPDLECSRKNVTSLSRIIIFIENGPTECLSPSLLHGTMSVLSLCAA